MDLLTPWYNVNDFNRSSPQGRDVSKESEELFTPIYKMNLKMHRLTSLHELINSVVFGKSLREMRHYQSTGNVYKV